MTTRELQPNEWAKVFDCFSRQFEGKRVTLEVILGDAAAENMTHVIPKPLRVRVAQVTNGQDEILLVDSGTGPMTRVDFRPVSAVDRVAGTPV